MSEHEYILTSERLHPAPMRLLLADHSHCMCRAMHRLLKTEPRIEVLGEARSLIQLLQMVAELRPVVIVMDFDMIDEQAIDRNFIRSQLACSAVLAISDRTDDETRAFAEKYGAAKFLDKFVLDKELIPTILILVNSRSTQGLDFVATSQEIPQATSCASVQG